MTKSKIHPETCTCRTCKRHRKEHKKDEQMFTRVIYGLFIIILIIFSVI